MVLRSKARTQSASFILIQRSPFHLSLFTSSLEWTFSVRLSCMIPQWFPSPVPFSRAKTAKIATPVVPKTYGPSKRVFYSPHQRVGVHFPRTSLLYKVWQCVPLSPEVRISKFLAGCIVEGTSPCSPPHQHGVKTALYRFFTTWSVSNVIKKMKTVLCNVYLCICHFVLPCANYHIVCFYMQVWANNVSSNNTDKSIFSKITTGTLSPQMWCPLTLNSSFWG